MSAGNGVGHTSGWKVPGYTELKALGSGGFGDVMLARHDASRTLVAIKYLRRTLMADPEFAEMFRGEATTLAALDDPNVVRLYEYVESPSGAAIVMELVGGVSLREILKFHGKTTPEAALVVLQGSLLGLAAAHRRGVVHRDYKPENVLVNGDGVSKLTDFGIAARAGERPAPAGSLLYAAPEQMGGAPASPAGDVYAATATFYECLTGRPPFSAETAEALLYQHLSQPVPLDPVPEPLRPLVTAGMAKDPMARPTDAATFVTELNTVAAGAYGRRWADRGRSHLGEAALLLAALWPAGPPPTVQGTTVYRIPLYRRSKQRRSTPRRSNPRRVSLAGTAIAASAAIAVVAASLALAAAVGHGPGTPSRPAAAVQAVPLQPSSGRPSPNMALGTGTAPSLTQTSQPGSAPSQTQTSLSGSAPSQTQTSPSGSAPSQTQTSPSGPSPSPTQTSPSGPSPSPTQTSPSGPSPSPTQTSPSGEAAPAAPSGLTADAVDSNDIELSWQANSSDQTGFEISNGVTSTDVGPDSTSYTWGDLSPGTYMCFKILAYNSAGDSAWDPDVSPWYVCTTTPGNSSPTPTASPPAAPSGLTADAVDSNDIELSWQANSSDQTGFEISNGVTSTDVGPDSTSYTWGDLSPGTYMCFKILAYNSAGDSAWDPDVSPWYVCTTTPSSGGVG